jgi:hypothetical protein
MAEARHVRAAHLGEQRSWLFSIALRDGQPIDALFEILYSEDLSDGQRYGTVPVKNPLTERE